MSDKKNNIFSLHKEIAVVTGGAGNLGPFWAKALKNAGAQVILLDIKGKKMPREYQSYATDITNLEELHQVSEKIKNDIGEVTILINNAGIDAPPGVKISDHSKIWQVNVQGAVNCIDEFGSLMKNNKSGSIINIGSLYLERSPDERFYEHLGTDKPWAYGASKAALHSVTRHYATRFAKFGIRVNTLSPGGVFNNQDKEFVKKYSERVPLGRMADRVKDLGGPLIFLASKASSYVTGINLQVNGGYTAW